MSTTMSLRQQLSDGPIVVAPGVYDALGASLAQKAGFRTLYLSGASIAYTRFGRPDIGLVGMSEVAETLSVIRERVDLPIVVDADTGFGNALNVQRTVALFERCGAAAIQIEDQTLPKRCGHLTGKSLISIGEMTGKVRAACDARRTRETLIVARTDAIAVEGLAAALERASSYIEAGADIAFVEAPRSLDEMKQVVAALGRRVPLIANMVEGGSTPALDAAALQVLGFRLAIFPGGLVRAIGKLMGEYFASLHHHGSTEPFRARMLDFAGLNEVLGTADILERGKSYDESSSVLPVKRKGAAE